MTKASLFSDSIAFKEISTGHNSAGNGGDGYNSGNIITTASIDFQPHNKAEGADVHVNTGDQGHQPLWGGGPTASADLLPTSGHETPGVNADTIANQSNWLAADQSQTVYAGIGGAGGNNNSAPGGAVQFDPSMETNLHIHVNDFGHIV